ADVILATPELPEGLRSDTREILAASRRAKTLIDQLLVHSRKRTVAPRVIDLNAQVAQMEGMLRRLIGEHVGLVATLAQDLGEVLADPGQMQQVIMNLCVNARDAMPDGGTLSLRTDNARVTADDDPSRPGLTPGDWVVLAVRDTGMGMDEETLSRIFEPFFTTKAEGRGTGLGLSTVYGIVTQSGGRIFVQSATGAGSTFEIWLPKAGDAPSHVAVGELRQTEAAQTAAQAAVEEPRQAGAAQTTAEEPRQAEAAQTEATQAAAPSGSGRILLVEDETAVRELARTILQRAGYTVVEAGHGSEAMAVYESLDTPIDLLVTDVVMPVMGGTELARRLHVVRPDLKVIYVTGYADDTLDGEGVFQEGTNLLRKPFNAGDLVALVAKVLRGATFS
ncbi:MAG TPA: ATP-binding protein, partial [Spirochaetia bacterium]